MTLLTLVSAEQRFDNQPMQGDRVKAIIDLGLRGRPEHVHHATREMSWEVPEVVEVRYLLCVRGPLPMLPNHEGRFVLDAVKDDRGEWLISPNTAAYPRGMRD